MRKTWKQVIRDYRKGFLADPECAKWVGGVLSLWETDAEDFKISWHDSGWSHSEILISFTAGNNPYGFKLERLVRTVGRKYYWENRLVGDVLGWDDNSRFTEILDGPPHDPLFNHSCLFFQELLQTEEIMEVVLLFFEKQKTVDFIRKTYGVRYRLLGESEAGLDIVDGLMNGNLSFQNGGLMCESKGVNHFFHHDGSKMKLGDFPLLFRTSGTTPTMEKIIFQMVNDLFSSKEAAKYLLGTKENICFHDQR